MAAVVYSCIHSVTLFLLTCRTWFALGGVGSLGIWDVAPINTFNKNPFHFLDVTMTELNHTISPKRGCSSV